MTYPNQIRLSEAAERYFDQLGTDIATGDVLTVQLSPALSQFYWLAFWAGHAGHDAECDARLQQMRWQRDLWYFVANNKGKTPRDFYAKTTDALWAEASR